ncbi:bifunctional oligoribonuclease/PAP phosphatase NrnA [Lacrimispora sp. NSJ-141]|uniref:Bifunctional oligoribonuclease/PAP phosphatase NrnA n=1 Tax=Lientehia hominis TaxID=2897778 RepID=A0AAP2W827_9FIRM|nr:bifunctional oligoribonuclease/PAP phosphatase NrnA [Lientehia hominis]MCD2491606.1 bifunctional oligoribonuclease/PAP phosphatase NrnA [Lientehia hominis]
MERLKEILTKVNNVAVIGHVRPDGDCVGSCLGLRNYLELSAPELQVQVYLESFPESFGFLKGAETVSHDTADGNVYDLCIVLDASDKERLGGFAGYFDHAGKTVCIDHHVTNTGFAGLMHVRPECSATSEVLYTLMDDAYVDRQVAECLYMGIVHDTGVFKHSNTTRATMEIAGRLIEKGIPFSEIIDRTFYEKTYKQNQILGRALTESVQFMDGACIYSAVRQKDLDFYQVETKDLDGIIDQLRITKGVECAVFLYETSPQEFKVSMRSNNVVDVSRIAAFFGGGGHVRASGCTMTGSVYDVINNLSERIEMQLMDAGLR